LHPKAQKREDVVKKRNDWQKNQKNLDIKRLKFLDESSVNCGMTRLYGRAKSNERVNDYVPDVRFERTSIIGVLGLDGIKADDTFKGTLNGEKFGNYVKKILAPTLENGDILVLDNLSVHKVKGVLDPLFEKGVKVWFLPPYSSDFNPIENAWSKTNLFSENLKLVLLKL
jgi:transposase